MYISNNKMLKIFLFASMPIWAVPYVVFYFIPKELWNVVSEWIDGRE